MERHEIIAESDGYDSQYTFERLRLVATENSKRLEIEDNRKRFVLDLDEDAYRHFLERVRAINPSSANRNDRKSAVFCDGALVVSYDNRGDPYAEGLRFSLEDPATGEDVSVFLTNSMVANILSAAAAHENIRRRHQ